MSPLIQVRVTIEVRQRLGLALGLGLAFRASVAALLFFLPFLTYYFNILLQHLLLSKTIDSMSTSPVQSNAQCDLYEVWCTGYLIPGPSCPCLVHCRNAQCDQTFQPCILYVWLSLCFRTRIWKRGVLYYFTTKCIKLWCEKSDAVEITLC